MTGASIRTAVRKRNGDRPILVRGDDDDWVGVTLSSEADGAGGFKWESIQYFVRLRSTAFFIFVACLRCQGFVGADTPDDSRVLHLSEDFRGKPDLRPLWFWSRYLGHLEGIDASTNIAAPLSTWISLPHPIPPHPTPPFLSSTSSFPSPPPFSPTIDVAWSGPHSAHRWTRGTGEGREEVEGWPRVFHNITPLSGLYSELPSDLFPPPPPPLPSPLPLPPVTLATKTYYY